MKPMLASPYEPSLPLRLPVLASPKLDGIRALVVDGVVMSRAMKPIPNQAIQAMFGQAQYNGLDGELISGPATAKDVMQASVSTVMSADKRADNVTYYVFDDWAAPGGYRNRLDSAFNRARHSQMNPLVHALVENEAQLMEYEDSCVSAGYEGIMIRDPSGHYKQGRSTAREGLLLKVKRFEDAEAVVIGTVEEMHNTNEAKINALGHTERSTSKEGKVGKGRLGALQVRLPCGTEFEIGSGYDAEHRNRFWHQREDLIGKIVTFRHQPSGAKDKPRFPVFHGFRDARDVS